MLKVTIEGTEFRVKEFLIKKVTCPLDERFVDESHCEGKLYCTKCKADFYHINVKSDKPLWE